VSDKIKCREIGRCQGDSELTFSLQKALTKIAYVMATCSVLAAGLMQVVIAHAECPDSHVTKQSAIEAFTLDHFRFAYQDGSTILLKISDAGRDILWDPANLQAVPWEPAFQSLRRINISIPTPPEGKLLSLQRTGSSSISALSGRSWPNGDHLIHFYNSSPTRSSWEDYFEIMQGESGSKEFFVVVAEKANTFLVSRLAYNGDQSELTTVETLTQDYGPGDVIGALSLSYGELLLIPQRKVFPCNERCVYAIIISRLPNETVSVNNSIYIVPYEIMAPALKQAGQKLDDRYRMVIGILSKAKSISTSNLKLTCNSK